MSFSGQYLTYSEYKLLGGTLDEMPFNLLEIKSRQIIDRESQRRLVGVQAIPNEVKTCMFELIETMALNGAYKDVDTAEKEKLLNSIVYNSLVSVIFNNTPLLYRGV